MIPRPTVRREPRLVLEVIFVLICVSHEYLQAWWF